MRVKVQRMTDTIAAIQSLTCFSSPCVFAAPASNADEEFDRGPEGRLQAAGPAPGPLRTETGESMTTTFFLSPPGSQVQTLR